MGKKGQPEEKKKCPSGAPMWMTTFSDLMSLLLCFFVLLLSFSEMDVARFKEVAGSLKDAFGVQRQEIIYDIPKGLDIVSKEFTPQFTVDELLERVKSAIKLELIKGEIEIEALEDRVVLRLKDEILFDPGSAQLRPAARPILIKLAQALAGFDGEVLVAGHTDSIPPRPGSRWRSNWELSAVRATMVLEFLLSQKTIAPYQTAAIGYGDSRPLYPNDTPQHRAANRRVEIILIQKGHSGLESREVFSGGLDQGPLPR